jgi:methyltransferase (TIGR00027 family)
MEQNRVSITALVTAYARVYHATHDNPKVFDDFLAPQLFTEQEVAFFAKNVAMGLSFFDPELAATCLDEASTLACVMRLQSAPVTLSRSRYTEESLEKAVADGVEQYVILGAGLDTFAFRRPDLLDKIQVFELDHPTTQADKRRRIAEAGWEQPAALHWVPADFSNQDLATALRNSTYDPRKMSFFSWLGVTYYLTREQVNDTLRAVAGLAPSGTPIVFDYYEADAFVPERAGKIVKRVQEIVKHAGEPMKMGFEPRTLSAELAALGWRLVENLGPDDIQERFFAGRTDGYHAFEQTYFARAVVA